MLVVLHTFFLAITLLRPIFPALLLFGCSPALRRRSAAFFFCSLPCSCVLPNQHIAVVEWVKKILKSADQSFAEEPAAKAKLTETFDQLRADAEQRLFMDIEGVEE